MTRYLSDGAYAQWDESYPGFWITAQLERGEQRIMLEPEGLLALIEYAREIGLKV